MRAAVIFLIGLLAAGVTLPQVSLAQAHPEISIPRSEQRTIRASDDGREYRIQVVKPHDPPASPAGYPVIYYLDANAVTGIFADVINLRSRHPSATGVVPAVLVGIGYPTDQPFDPRRSYDLTPPSPTGALPPRPDGSPWPKTGGADAFIAFIERDVKPVIERDFKIDRSRQTLFGHSFGGLFVLHTLFTRPELYQTYIAGSPSIWFNDRYILQEERAFAARLATAPVRAELLIAVGGWEQELSPYEIRGNASAERAGRKQQNRMVDNAREMAARFATLSEPGLSSRFIEFPEEDHTSVLPALISRAAQFALSPRP